MPKCNICKRERGNDTGTIFIQTHHDAILHARGYYLFVCIECYVNYIAQYFNMDIKGVEWYLKYFYELEN